MIDIERDVFDTCARAVLAKHAGAFVASEQTRSPESFPAVYLVESANTTNMRMQDNQEREQYADVTYTANVYSNLLGAGAAKGECRDIACIIDEAMASMGIRRTWCGWVENLSDTSVRRYVMRFAATVRYDGTVFRRS